MKENIPLQKGGHVGKGQLQIPKTPERDRKEKEARREIKTQRADSTKSAHRRNIYRKNNYRKTVEISRGVGADF
ncbi:MAG: hypothetical protein H8E29_04375 [Anaerolineales bacterium]|uniref:Uncharacterized protein n=1 Tax=Candidatus Desulfolinea nitratireducens TaxID=2841698 RepID=A0A8J6NFI0_9CHLR|nr:hypothetical protein [Candidatus Desulfolinea nitratireducens]